MNYDIQINDSIGWPISARDVCNELGRFKNKPCKVLISSPGGSVIDALQIYQAFKDHGQVTAYIFGLTASAATIIAMGAKRVEMSRHALFLIHQASMWSEEWGRMNSKQISEAIGRLSKTAEDLDKIDGVIAGIYAERAQKPIADFKTAMEEEQWRTADEVKDLGLIDAIIEQGEAPVIDNSLRARLTACALPIPEIEDAGKKNEPAEDRGFWAELRRHLGLSDNKPSNNTPMQEEQKKEPTQEPKKVENTQHTLENDLQARISALEEENKKLKDQIAAHGAADGAATTDPEPEETEDKEVSAAKFTREFVDKFGDII